MIDNVEIYVEQAYQRIWDNFVFSWNMYAAHMVYQRRLCLESLAALEALYKRLLMTDGVVSTGWYHYYRKLIMVNYDRVRSL